MTRLFLFALALAGFTNVVSAQASMIKKAPKFFTLRNAKLTTGIVVSGNINASPDSDKNQLKTSVGQLPPNIAFDFGEGDTLHYLAATLLLDYSSPNSILGVILGAEYNLNRFGLRDENTNEVTSFQVQTARFPAYLKIKIGGIHSRTNGIILMGLQYSTPLAFKRRLPSGMDVRGPDEVSNGLYWSGLAGIQVRKIIRNEVTMEAERARSWLFVRAERAINRLLSDQGQQEVFGSNAPSASFKDLNVSFGISFFFGAG